MRCTRFFGHKWSKWSKRFGKISIVSNQESRPIMLVRRCAVCGFQEERWMDSVYIKDIKKEDGKDT